MSLLTIASYNVHKCVGTDRRFNPGRVTEVIAELGADLLALQEVDRRFGRRIGLLDLAELERRTGLRHIPLSLIPQGQGWHGNALLLREGEVTSIRRMSLPGGEPRGAVAVELRLHGARLRVVATHFGLLKQHRLQQCGAILELLAQEALPTVILGDLNEWRVGRRSSLLPLHQSLRCSQFSPATFPSRLPLLPLDRIMAWPNALVRDLEVHDTALARVASDHLPLKARLDLEAAAAQHGADLVSRAA